MLALACPFKPLTGDDDAGRNDHRTRVADEAAPEGSEEAHIQIA